jgi:tetratricopeptide (TPR) repeat protein
MNEAGESVTRRHPRWIRWTFGLATLVGIGILGCWAARSWIVAPTPTWEEIERAQSRRRWAEMEAKLARWIAAKPEHAQARLMLADLLLRLGRRDEAVSSLSSVPQSNPAWSQVQTMLGELAISERQAAHAEQIFRQVATRDPRALAPRQRLIYLLGMQQRTAEARAVLWEIYRIHDDPRVLVDLVLDLLLDQQDVRGFPPELEQFVAQTPSDPLLRRAWGMSLLYQGRVTEALPHLEAAASQVTNDPIGRFALAECRIMAGQSVDPDGVLGLRPQETIAAAQWWLFRGRIDESTGQPQRAAASFEQSLALHPENREVHFRLSQIQKQLGRFEESKRHLDASNQIDERIKRVRREHQQVRRAGLPSDAGLFLRLGRLCVGAGLIAESRAWCEQALKLDRTFEDAKTDLARLEALPSALPFSLAAPALVSSPGSAPPNRSSAEPNYERGLRETGSASVDHSPPFDDSAAATGVSFFYESGATSGRLFIADTMGGGVGLIDYDNDGRLDIYFVNGCAFPFDTKNPPEPNVMYRNQGDGTFRDVTARCQVGGKGYGMGCAVGDYDNDGDDDLFVTGFHRTVLYRNRGDGTFEDMTRRAGVDSDRWTTAAGFGDLDGDGDLDLVVATYVEASWDDDRICRDQAGWPIHCTPGFYNAQADLLYRNNGDGTFTEVSKMAGFEAPNGRGLGLAIADFDGDGKLDIFVANDATPNFLFRNRGGWKFEEIGMQAGVATNGAGRATASMGVVADDLDGDGRIDLFVTNLVNESSTFFRNLGEGLFVDSTLGAGLDAASRPKTGFGDAALDADNDGFLDLFVANGHVDNRPWANSPMAQTALFFWGRSHGRFVVAEPARSSYFARPFVGRGGAAGDLNNDGHVDLVVVHRDAPAAVLWNRSRIGHWLGVRLRGTRSPKTPVGARVTCRAGGRCITRWLTGGTGYLASHDSRLWIGLGTASRVDRLEIAWPSGLIQTFTELPVDRILEIREGAAQTKQLRTQPNAAHSGS